MTRLPAVLLTLLALAAPAAAHEITAGEIQIIHPHLTATSPAAKSAAGYLAIVNEGAEAERLLAVRADFAEAQLHLSEVGADGVARMSPVEAVEIPAGETVVLEPGGLHLMFMGLAAPLAEGQTRPATLVFEHAGELEVEFEVEAREGPGGTDHSGH